MGCPVRKVTKTGAGSSLIETDGGDLACRLVEAVAERRRRAGDGEDAPRPARRLARRSSPSGRASSRPARAGADAAPALGAADVHGPRRPLADGGAGRGRRRAGDRVRRRHVARRAPRPCSHTTGCAAVMIARAAQGNPWLLRELATGDGRSSRRTTRSSRSWCATRAPSSHEIGERRAVPFLRKFHPWYLRRGTFPRTLRQELAGLAHARRRSRRACSPPRRAPRRWSRSGATSRPTTTRDAELGLPISLYGGG